MVRVIEPLGGLITTLPAGPGYEGRTAGPSFELFYESDYLMPHREAAWALLAERLDEAAQLCDQLASGNGQPIAGQLKPVFAAMREISQSLVAHLPAGSAHRRAAAPNRPQPAEFDAVLGRARDMAASVAGQPPVPSWDWGPGGPHPSEPQQTRRPHLRRRCPDRTSRSASPPTSSPCSAWVR